MLRRNYLYPLTGGTPHLRISTIESRRQHLKLAEKDIKKVQGIEGGSKAFFLDTDSAAKVGIFSERQGGFTQNIQVQRGYILTGPRGILIKDDIQTPVRLFLYVPVLAHCIGKPFRIGNGFSILPWSFALTTKLVSSTEKCSKQRATSPADPVSFLFSPMI